MNKVTLNLTRRALLRSGVTLSVSSLAFRSFATADALLTSSQSVSPNVTLEPAVCRERILFDFGWKFFQGNADNAAQDLNFGKNQRDFAKTGAFSFATDEFDDSKWRSLDLPHDWAVELRFVDDKAIERHGFRPLGRSYPETSIGWYRRSFDVPKEDAGRRIYVEFDGAFRSALIFVNGCFIGRHDDGYTPFRFDLSDFLNYGSRNYIVVRMDASSGEGWFYEGAGIYRHVWLTKMDPVHLGQWESYVRTGLKDGVATLSMGTIVENQANQVESVHVHWRILDAEGRNIATAHTAPQSIEPDGSATFIASSTISKPSLWSPESPYLYSAIVTVETAGKARDAERLDFGVRTVVFDVNKGFFLNGKSVKIKGTCNHQDHAGVGAALPDRLQWYRLNILKEMGSNAVRTSHNMPTPEWVRACDRMGMMMMCETRTMSSNPTGLNQLEVMIKRYRNSPAIIIWSVGNEEWLLQGKDLGERIVATMARRAHELDPTRLCTGAVNTTYNGGVSKPLDVEGFNYNLPKIDEYHRTHPRQPLIGSETASTICTRGIYITDPLRNWVSAYDVNRPSAGAELAEEWWKFYAARDFLPGGFAWTGFDYRGEPTPYSWPSISSQFGIVDTCGFPKDNYYYYKSWWGKKPILHLFPHWNWDQRIGGSIPVWVHSNLEEVELFHNGRSQGRQKVQPLTHLEWNVKYAPGSIEARGFKDGKVVMITKRETTGKPAVIRITADRTTIDADAKDVAVLRVEALDNKGRHVPTASSHIILEVTGEGVLLGVGNGDPNCHESDKAPERSLFNGLMQVIVRSTKTPGSINIEARCNEGQDGVLLPAKVSITTQNVD